MDTTQPPGSVADLLLQREAAAVGWTTRARLAFCLIGAALVTVVAGSADERLALLGMIALMAGGQLLILRALRRQPRAVHLGWAGAGTDLLVLLLLPLIWHLIYTRDVEPLAHLAGHNYSVICTALIALNGLTLRPRYPAVVAGGGVATHLILGVLALTDPRVQHFPGGLNAALGVGTSELDRVLVTPFLLACTGLLVSLAARHARRTVEEAVEREHREGELRERQLEAVLDARMAAVGDLVAGVEHEVNSPLGALRSASDTARRAVARVRERIAPEHREDASTALKALDNAVELTGQASARLHEVMETLGGFVHLDEAERQRLRLAELVHGVLRAQRHLARDDTDIRCYLDDGLVVDGDPQRLSQAVATVLRNALESFDGPGTVTVRLREVDGMAHLEIVDTGRGIPSASIDGLFDIDFAHGERTRARLGLPTCRSILRRHGGDVVIDSSVGVGTTVRVTVPVV